jgi:hypothetical protein
MSEKDDFDVIEISEEEVKLQFGGTRLTISGILSKRHAQILIAVILAMLGYNHEVILGAI